jgi:hypothetical protein
MSELAVSPIDDVNMVYDYNRHKYFITQQYMLDEYGVNLTLRLYDPELGESTNAPDIFLRKVSNYFYEMIYAHSMNRNLTEYLLAKTIEYREKIKFCLGELANYILDNGLIGEFAGVNFDKSSIMDIKETRNERLFPVVVMWLLRSSGLLYLGQLNYSGSADYTKDLY